MPIVVTTGQHTPAGTTIEEVEDLSNLGAGIYHVAIDLTAMQGGDTVIVSASVKAGDTEQRLVQEQTFIGDQGFLAAELVVPSDGSNGAAFNIQQSAGTARTFDYATTRIYEA